MTLYRSTSSHERRRRLYGFSWTTDAAAVAWRFAEHWAQPGGLDFHGLVLRTLAPPEAILLVRPPEDYYDEGEVVVNPYRLGKVEVSETLRPILGNE